MARQGETNLTTVDRGREAETLAANYLGRQGLRVIERNYRIRGGEIDLICRDGDCLVFVEVRLRRRSDFGGAADSITWQKRRRLILAARHYLLRWPRAACRFDCILLSAPTVDALEWIRHAFTLDD